MLSSTTVLQMEDFDDDVTDIKAFKGFWKCRIFANYAITKSRFFRSKHIKMLQKSCRHSLLHT